VRSGIEVVVLDRDGRSINSSRTVKTVPWELTRRFSRSFRRCSVICVSHAPVRPSWLLRDRHQYLIWHGVNHKELVGGWTAQSDRLFAGAVAASEPDGSDLATSFGFASEQILVTGYPRIGHLRMARSELPEDLQDQDQTVSDLLDGRRMILLAPTWEPLRDSAYELPALVDAMTAAACPGVVVGIRLHPNTPRGIASAVNYPGVVDLGADMLPSTEVVLRHTGLLVTDFSSIWVDYTVLGRPVLSFGPHLARYLGSGRLRTGFLNDFPGPIIKDREELTEVLRLWCSGDAPNPLARPDPESFHPPIARPAKAALLAITEHARRR
jgi:CDP-glycerol glycerophosphotransferase (TagB/SpsB family)